jgi:hypothetical protein
MGMFSSSATSVDPLRCKRQNPTNEQRAAMDARGAGSAHGGGDTISLVCESEFVMDRLPAADRVGGVVDAGVPEMGAGAGKAVMQVDRPNASLNKSDDPVAYVVAGP